MLTSQRRALIQDRLRQDGQVVAKDLAEAWQVSEDTIRRDLRDMAGAGLLLRVHGGALPVQPPLPDFSARTQVATDVKAALGRCAAGMIQPGQVIFLDGGTTTAQIVRHLPLDIRLTVVTHSPTVAGGLEHHGGVEVILIGGRLYKHSMVSVGAAAMAAIATIRSDIYFMGVTAIHPVRGLSTGDYEEAAIKRHIAQHAAETIVMATVDKLDAVSPYTIAPADNAAAFIVPAGTDDAVTAPYCALGIRIIAA